MQHRGIEATAFGDEQVLEGCFDLGSETQELGLLRFILGVFTVSLQVASRVTARLLTITLH